MKDNLATKEQLEISFNDNRVCRSAARPARRMGRAQWWFTQMRQVVDRAIDRQPRNAPPGEQMYLAVTRNELDASAGFHA